MGFGDPFLLFLIQNKDEEHLLVVVFWGSFFPFEKFLSAGQSAVVRGQHEIWNFVGKFVTSRMLIKYVSCIQAAGLGGKYHNKQTSDSSFLE